MKRNLAIIVAWLLCASSAAATTVTKTASTGESFNYVLNSTGLVYRVLSGDGVSSRYDLVIIADGYTDSAVDQARFDEAAETFAEGFLNVSPYKESRQCINVIVINLVSPESGIDDPDTGLLHNTALDCSFTTASMEITGDYDKVAMACNLAGVSWDIIYVLVNDSKSHDGSWYEPFKGIAFSSDLFAWGTVMAHEVGHGVAYLADEYRAPKCVICGNCATCPVDCASKVGGVTYTASWEPDEPNITKQTDPALVKWKDLLATTAIPTTLDHVCEGDVIGVWEGAASLCFGVYRPREYCLMDGVTGDDPLIDDFCSVCSRAITQALSAFYGCGTP